VAPCVSAWDSGVALLPILATSEAGRGGSHMCWGWWQHNGGVGVVPTVATILEGERPKENSVRSHTPSDIGPSRGPPQQC
jgi:hypothetical protein